MMGMACRREDRFQSVGALAAALGLAAGPVMPTGQGGTAVVPETVRTGDGTLFPPPGDDGRTILTPQDDGRTVLTGEHGYRLMEDIVSDGGAAPPAADRRGARARGRTAAPCKKIPAHSGRLVPRRRNRSPAAGAPRRSSGRRRRPKSAPASRS